ncbi:MAG: hypothetical protein HY216_07800 [Candidatus Rokubacteria bacterium]|nr:hypothetical protein [Candidatus Rokubacteria bacterium]
MIELARCTFPAARGLSPVWIDFRGGLARGARNFRDLGARRGDVGSPAAARAATGERAMALRGRLIGRALAEALAGWRPPPRR